MTHAPGLERRVEDWFDRLLELVDRSADRRHVVERDTGPIVMTHTFEAGSSHASLSDALAGGVEPNEDLPALRGRLTVHSLEAPPVDVLLPAPVTEDELAGRVGVRALEGTRWRLTWDAYAGVVRCFNRETATGIFVTVGRPEAWEFGAPFRAFLHWAAADRGAAMVHAAAVVGSTGAALVVGPGGTGKSTTAIVAVDVGLATLGDDYVWIEPAGDVHVVRSTYSTIKTKRGGLSPVVPIRDSVEVADGDKTIHHLDDPCRAVLVRSAPLASLVLLTPPGATPAGAAMAMVAAVPSTTLQLPYDESNTVALLRGVCESTLIVGLTRDGDLDRLGRELSALVGGPVVRLARPSVTVVIPVYNGERYLERAIESVFAQADWDLHVVAVDDGSTDGSRLILDRLASVESRLTVIRHDHNRGVGAARNAGVAARRDPLIAMIDQDDRWAPDRLDLGWAALENDNQLGFVFGHQTFELDGDGDPPAWFRMRWLDGPQAGHVFGALLAWRNAWDQVGTLDEDLQGGTDDADWFARARDAEVPHRMLADVVLWRTVHSGNASQRTGLSTQELTEVLRRSLRRRAVGGLS